MSDPNMAPDKPPPKPTGGNCCSSIAVFLTIGPKVCAWLSIGPVRLEIGASLGRTERPPRPSTEPHTKDVQGSSSAADSERFERLARDAIRRTFADIAT